MVSRQHINTQQAISLLKAGELVAMPTETVYGLAADATNPEAVAKIYALKSRPSHNPLIVHVADVARAQKLAHFSKTALKLAHHFWPGPLTLVLPLIQPSVICEDVSAGLDTIGLRVPGHSEARALLDAFDGGLAAPSANPSGRLSASLAEHVFDAFGNSLPVMEGEAPEVGLESSIVRVNGDEISLLREGAITQSAIEELLGRPIENNAQKGTKEPNKPQAPGMLLKHYAPRAPLITNATTWQPDDALLGFGPKPEKAPDKFMNLSETGDVQEAARHLYAMLHALDKMQPARIMVQAIPSTGVGRAINDRLARASAAKQA